MSRICARIWHSSRNSSLYVAQIDESIPAIGTEKIPNGNDLLVIQDKDGAVADTTSEPQPPDEPGDIPNADFPNANLPVLQPVPLPPAEDRAPQTATICQIAQEDDCVTVDAPRPSDEIQNVHNSSSSDANLPVLEPVSFPPAEATRMATICETMQDDDTADAAATGASHQPQNQLDPLERPSNVRNLDYPHSSLPVLQPVEFPPAEDYATCRRTRNVPVYNPEGKGSVEIFTVIARTGGDGRRAYALGKRLQTAIYGGVRHALGLRRRAGPRGAGDDIEWEIVPGEEYAIKWMRWAMILARREQPPEEQSAEDPESELAAMRLLERAHQDRERRRRLQGGGADAAPRATTICEMTKSANGANAVAAGAPQQPPNDADCACGNDLAACGACGQGWAQRPCADVSDCNESDGGGSNDNVEAKLNAPSATGGMAASLESHVIMLEDVLLDRIYLYSVMPFCSGGDLFDVVSSARRRFTEGEARYWMHQMIQGLETLQAAGLSHRDISLENLMVHNGQCLVIDMGLSLLVPIDPASNRRCLIEAEAPCGKWNYMSPEIYRSDGPFDGFAVDLWAVGVVLFVMLTDDFPWNLPDDTDPDFSDISGGGLAIVLQRRGVRLSDDVVDLLQQMMLRDPAVRFSLEQVKRHRWMRPPPKDK